MVKLNDGIFHPMYNPNGWRRPKDNKYWHTTTEVIGNSKDCFDKSIMLLSDGSTATSGRPDGNYLTYGSGTNVVEWN